MVKRNKHKFEMNWKKQALALVLVGILFSTSMFGLAGTGGQVRAAAPTQEANVVVLVDFNDTDHTQHQGNGGLSNYCFHINDNTNPTGAPAGNAAKTLNLFNGDASHERALSRYISTISYGQRGVANIFPQYDQATNTITPYKLTMNEDATLNPSGETAMVREVIAKLAENPSALQGADLNGDKVVDNLTIVVASHSTRESHKTSYGGNETANGLQVRDYLLYNERSIYGLGMEGVVAHEYLHHLGYPDLYRSGGGGNPVGDWCIMARANLRVNYPLAYLRSAYTGWFSIPTVTSSRAGNTLYAASAATAATKDQQALVLKTPYSDSEFFVVEYRKKGPDVSADPDALDAGIPDSGLIVYRVDTNYGTNFVGDRDMIYVFRPGDGYDGNGREQGLGNLNQASLSAESGRTSYGSPDFSKGLSNGAITYADGTNSGIVIKNVGSAAGDTITFDISFTENAGESYWTTVAEHGDVSLMTMDSYMDTDGTIYYLMQKGRAVFVYQCAGGTFRQMGTQLSGDGYSYQIAKFNGSIYVSCIRSGTAKVYRMGSGSWSEVYTSPIPVTELHMSAASDGIYLVYNSGDNSAIYALAVKASGLVPLGTTVGTGGQLVNPSIAAENGRVAVSYRDFNNQNKAYVKEYQQAQNSWSDVGNLNISWDFGMIKMHNGCLYLLQNVRSSGAYSSSLYRYRFADGIWEKVGSASYAAESIVEMDLCFYGDSPYLVYQGGASGLMYSASISNGIWTVLGSKITNEIVTGLKVYSYQNQIYVTYLGTTGKKIYLKSHVIQAGDTGAAPGGSTLPGQTTKPSDPSKPSEPSKPQQPEQPSQPGGSQQPVQPTEPGRPVRPQQPNQIVQIQPPTQSQQPASPAQPAQPAGVWVLNAVGWWYQYADGGYPTSCWLQIGGVWYAFDESGYMRTGWFWNGHAWYYLIPGSGAMAEGWQYINGVWYYLTPGSGAMAEGWQYINGLWYYLTPGSGAMQTGWVFTGGVWYYLTGSGAMAEGWQYINGEWYYLMPGSGAMQTGWYQAGGIWYYSDASGAMASSQWIGPYYVDSSGAWTRTR